MWVEILIRGRELIKEGLESRKINITAEDAYWRARVEIENKYNSQQGIIFFSAEKTK